MTTRKGISTAALAAVALLALPACGVGSQSGSDTTTTTQGGDTERPAEAIDIDAAIEASRDEGKVIVYGNPSADQWEPVLAAFQEEYPWIEVETFDLGGAEAFQRFLSEEATGATTADVIVNTDGAGWLDLIERGKVVDYVDPELADMPDIAVAAPGVFAMSVDPLIGIFNTRALPLDEQPDTLADLAAMSEELDGKIGTVDVENGQVGLGTYGYTTERGEEAWDVLEQIGPHSRVEDGSGALLSKLQTGEYEAAFMASGSIRALIDTTDAGDVLNYRYLTDATPLPTRGMAVTTAAGSPNAAKVLIHFLLSQEGQTAGCAGGFTPYRDDVECPQDLAAIEEVVGEGNALVVGYPEELTTELPAMRERWDEAFGR
jgi:iron(III) transport system substrate-binding protein